MYLLGEYLFHIVRRGGRHVPVVVGWSEFGRNILQREQSQVSLSSALRSADSG